MYSNSNSFTMSRDETLSDFQAITNIDDCNLDIAITHLEEANWVLEVSFRVYIP